MKKQSIDGSRLFWVDALCISQDDEKEKADQVASMTQIFQNASRVIVWLGQEENGSEIAMDAIQTFKDNPEENYEDLSHVITHPKNRSGTTIFDHSQFRPLQDLSLRSWFRRLWTAQEFVVGQRILFVCGSNSLESADFLKVVRRLSLLSFGENQPTTNPDDGVPFEGFLMLIDLAKSMTDVPGENKKLDFFDLVMFCRKRETLEPLDRIYALIGLADEKDAIYKQRLRIDYSKFSRSHYWWIYLEFAKIALTKEPHLKVLSYACSDHKSPQLPSWCPDLNSLLTTTPFSKVYAAGWPFQDDCPQGMLTCAAAHPRFTSKLETYVEISENSDKIRIPGVQLSRIAAVGPLFDWGPNFNSDDLQSVQPFARGFLQWIASCEEMISVVKTSKTSLSLLEDVLVEKTNPKRDTSDQGDDKEFSALAFLKVIFTAINGLAADESPNPDLRRYFESILFFIISLQETWTDRVMFVTCDNQVGFGYKDVAVNDQVCMLYSGHSLYVLRQSPGTDCHSFMGEAYLYGCVNGEVFDLLHAGTVHEEMFSIT